MSDDRELELLAKRLAEAKDYTDIFPDEHSITTVYRKLARLTHPDTIHAGNAKLISDTFARLTALRDEAKKMAEQGRFGKPEQVLHGKLGTHNVRDSMDQGDICTLFRTETTLRDGQKDVGVLKIARTARDNDFVANEATALKRLHAQPHTLQRHYPRLLDKFMYQPSSGARRRASVIEWHSGFTLTQLRPLYPDGLDPLHGAWIWRRMLMALGYAHDCGVLHGAVIPEHVLVHPSTHAVILLDWCYSRMANDQDKNQPILAFAGGRRRTMWYPEEVHEKKPPTPATDLYIAAQTIQWLLMSTRGRINAPREMQAYFRGCITPSQSVRPQSAWELLREFDDLLQHLGSPYHPRRYKKLAVPTGTVQG